MCLQGRAEWLSVSPYYRDLMSAYAGKVGPVGHVLCCTYCLRMDVLQAHQHQHRSRGLAGCRVA